MPRKTLTYGVLPSREEFEAQFRLICIPDGHYASDPEPPATFGFANDPRVGTCALTCSELWEELKAAKREWSSLEGDASDVIRQECAGRWCAIVLSILGFEWV